MDDLAKVFGSSKSFLLLLLSIRNWLKLKKIFGNLVPHIIIGVDTRLLLIFKICQKQLTTGSIVALYCT